MVTRNDESEAINLLNIEDFGTKSDIRSFLLNTWIQENSRTKYRYFVETLESGAQIYLERPGRLNKGCDFVIYIEGYILYQNGNDKPPKHDFIIADFAIKKKQLSDKQYKHLLKAVKAIYDCKPYCDAENYVCDLPKVGVEYEVLLKLLRWFFIEQDITYWAKSGRDMLFNAI
ncbi:MAG: hypothetical protein Q9N62_00790 [Ghiorsea sp.]|nr:hypothetical protein [Ghiorsea sp.]